MAEFILPLAKAVLTEKIPVVIEAIPIVKAGPSVSIKGISSPSFLLGGESIRKTGFLISLLNLGER